MHPRDEQLVRNTAVTEGGQKIGCGVGSYRVGDRHPSHVAKSATWLSTKEEFKRDPAYKRGRFSDNWQNHSHGGLLRCQFSSVTVRYGSRLDNTWTWSLEIYWETVGYSASAGLGRKSLYSMTTAALRYILAGKPRPRQ